MTYSGSKLPYDRELWEAAQRWAQEVELYGDGTPDVKAAAAAIAQLPNPVAGTVADMSPLEIKAYYGGAVQWEQEHPRETKRGWLVETSAYDGYNVIGEDGALENLNFDLLTPLPDEPRMVAPGLTAPDVRQTPPGDAFGWWATYEGNEHGREVQSQRVICLWDTPDDDGDTLVARRCGGANVEMYVPEKSLSDWSHYEHPRREGRSR